MLLYYFIASAASLLPQYRAKSTSPSREFLVYLIRVQCNPDEDWRKKRIARRQIGHQILSTCVPPVTFVLSSEIKKLMGRNFRANPPKNDGRDAANKPRISRNLNEISFRSFITVAWRLSSMCMNFTDMGTAPGDDETRTCRAKRLAGRNESDDTLIVNDD